MLSNKSEGQIEVSLSAVLYSTGHRALSLMKVGGRRRRREWSPLYNKATEDEKNGKRLERSLTFP